MLKTKSILLTRHFFTRWAERVLESKDINQARKMSEEVVNEKPFFQKESFTKEIMYIIYNEIDGEMR
jgi:hypothetical protein